MVTLQRIEL